MPANILHKASQAKFYCDDKCSSVLKTHSPTWREQHQWNNKNSCHQSLSLSISLTLHSKINAIFSIVLLVDFKYWAVCHKDKDEKRLSDCFQCNLNWHFRYKLLSTTQQSTTWTQHTKYIMLLSNSVHSTWRMR